MRPKNKRERMVVAKKKGLKRSEVLTARWDRTKDEYFQEIREHAKHLRNGAALCSRPCCGNPRHHYEGRTRKERASEFDFKQQLKDVA